MLWLQQARVAILRLLVALLRVLALLMARVLAPFLAGEAADGGAAPSGPSNRGGSSPMPPKAVALVWAEEPADDLLRLAQLVQW